MPQAAVKMFFLDDPAWPPPVPPTPSLGISGRMYRLQRLQGLGKLAILIEIGHQILERLRW